MSTKAFDRPSARERLLAAADELFYEEGVHIVGIDRVIERAGVAKASLYNSFGSKDELVRSYLEGRHRAREEAVSRKLAEYDTPAGRVLGVFDALDELVGRPGFRGCAFLNASGEAGSGSAVVEVCDGFRAWLRSLFLDLTRAAGARDPESLGRQLLLLYDGVMVSAKMDHDPNATAAARTVAAALLDAATRDAATRDAATSDAATSDAATRDAGRRG
jgi:AcrR family transcriptional regulator